MSPLRLVGRRRGPRRRISFPRRTATVVVGGALVGAMVLGTATSSAHGGGLASPTPEPEAPVIVADVVRGAPVALLGFAPPPEKPAARLPAPQFRLASDLPSGPLGIPGMVLQAYKLAANRVAAESPQCKLPWFLLAGIGRIESNHASNGSVDQYGTTINPIAGPVLDGSLAGNAVIKDTDGGRIDGDPGHDRAMGPMQFIPSTWAGWGSDANGDGKPDPNNIFDATYSAGRYLCAGVTDIMNERTRVSAVLRYNRSMEYVSNVLGWAGAYATGVMPTNPIPEMKRKASRSSSSKPSKPSAPPSGSSSSSSSSTSRPAPPTQTCVIICFPSIPLPGQPAPPPTKKQAPGPKQTPPAQAAPNRPGSTTTPVPVR
ncbi:lytic murein transglycosylase [Gordonia sp. zg691]|uniref:lytic transglycosylase domain-containing protein n=1 Tax=Gordonia jinghuaiqii TaxID=2758710 RepID=UPI0016622E7A|nr:lytic murein transglycosylase [Gordonia jinghuaiqii]MBD0863741.1 lytic murein transglycosylase [Gordonia jinghuaiqii]